MSVNWKLGERLDINGAVWTVVGRTAEGDVNLFDDVGLRYDARSERDLATLWKANELKRLPPAGKDLNELDQNQLRRDFDDFPEHLQKAAERRAAYAQRVLSYNLSNLSEANTGPIIQQVAAEIGDPNPPSPRLVADWIKLMRRGGGSEVDDIRYLAPRYHMRGNRKNRFDPEVEQVLWEVIEENYLKRQPHPIPDIYSQFKSIVLKIPVAGRDPKYLSADGTHLRYHSLRSVYERIASIPNDEKIAAHHGSVAARALCNPVILGPQGEFPLSDVEIDYHLVDVLLLDTTRNIVIGKAWLGTAMCVFTRTIGAAIVSYHPPSAWSTQMLVKQLIEPKDDILAQYPEIRNPWPVYGVPRTIKVDNAAENHSRSFRAAMQSLGINIQYCPVRSPQTKGKKERFYHRLETQLIHHVPGTTLSNSQERGDYKAEDEAVMTLADLKAHIYQWIVDDYHVTLHDGLGDIPLRKWTEGVKSHPVRLPDSVEKVECLNRCIEFRALTRKGIELYGLRYSEKTKAFKQLINRADKPTLVMVKVDPNDLSSIQIEDWRTGRLYPLPAVDQVYTAGLSLAEHDAVKARVRAQLGEYERATMRQLLDTRDALRDKIKQLKRAKKLARKQNHRLDGEEERLAGNPAPDPMRLPPPATYVPVDARPHWTGAKPPMEQAEPVDHPTDDLGDDDDDDTVFVQQPNRS